MAQGSVGDVFAVPRQQVFYPVYRRDGNVQRIDLSLSWKGCTQHELFGELLNYFGSRKEAHTGKHGQALLNCDHIARTALVDDKLRNANVV